MYTIRPGESIGPWRLRMTRAAARRLADREVVVDQTAVTGSNPTFDYFPQAAVRVYYDPAGCCSMIEALIGYPPEDTPKFLLCGVAINDLDDAAIIALCAAHWPDTTNSYTGLRVPSAGLKASYWEYTDHFYYSMAVLAAVRSAESDQ